MHYSLSYKLICREGKMLPRTYSSILGLAGFIDQRGGENWNRLCGQQENRQRIVLVSQENWQRMEYTPSKDHKLKVSLSAHNLV